MDRRAFVRLLAAGAHSLGSPDSLGLPALRVVSSFAPWRAGMPGPYPGRVVAVTSDTCVDSRRARPTTRPCRDDGARHGTLTARTTLTRGAASLRQRRRRHQSHCGGYPHCISGTRDRRGGRAPAHGDRRAGVADLTSTRGFQNQVDDATTAASAKGVQIVAAERANRYDADNTATIGHLPRGGSLGERTRGPT